MAKTQILFIAATVALLTVMAGCGGAGIQENASTATVTSAETGMAQLTEAQLRGRAVFEENCMKCHAVNGQGGTVGPDLTHESAPPPPGYVLLPYRQFYSMYLDNPQWYRPDVKMPKIPLTPEQKNDVIEYLLTLT